MPYPWPSAASRGETPSLLLATLPAWWRLLTRGDSPSLLLATLPERNVRAPSVCCFDVQRLRTCKQTVFRAHVHMRRRVTVREQFSCRSPPTPEEGGESPYTGPRLGQFRGAYNDMCAFFGRVSNTEESRLISVVGS